MVDQTRLLENGPSTLKHNEVGNALHLKAGGELRVGFGVHLKDDGLTGHISGCARNLGSRRSAWTAPTSPEVNQDRHGCVLHNIVKGSRVDSKRLSEWRKLGLASSTSARCT